MAVIRAPVNPDLIRWASERSQLPREHLVKRFPKLPAWEKGEVQPTLNQAERFAQTVFLPLGDLFLASPPDEPLPIADFRTLTGRGVTRPSPNLLDTIYDCQERQDWYREYARSLGEPELTFVGRATLRTPPETAASHMREVLGFDLAARRECATWEEAMRLFANQAERVGILVMLSGIVKSNTRRRLDPDEFRGFALADPIAPLVFVNTRDAKAAQIFTLAHELAHIWLGTTALTNASVAPRSGGRRKEVWCNATAAEFLVPLAALRPELRKNEPLERTLPRLARLFKVSRLVTLRRLFDARWIQRDRFDVEWKREMNRLGKRAIRRGGGGDFYRTTLARVGNRFARALIASTLEGGTLYGDAFWMLGIRRDATFESLGREVGLIR